MMRQPDWIKLEPQRKLRFAFRTHNVRTVIERKNMNFDLLDYCTERPKIMVDHQLSRPMDWWSTPVPRPFLPHTITIERTDWIKLMKSQSMTIIGVYCCHQSIFIELICLWSFRKHTELSAESQKLNDKFDARMDYRARKCRFFRWWDRKLHKLNLKKTKISPLKEICDEYVVYLNKLHSYNASRWEWNTEDFP